MIVIYRDCKVSVGDEPLDICEQASKALEEHKIDIIDSLYEVVENCESPIQQMLLVRLCRVFDLKKHGPKTLRGLLPGLGKWYDNIFHIFVEVEREITVPTMFEYKWETDYRADIYIWLTRYTYGLHQERINRHVENGGTEDTLLKLSDEEHFDLSFPELGKLVIECDGHDFHDRTKEQASKDRRRDREMLTAGYPVFRYTGHDIHHELDEIHQEIWGQLYDMAHNIYTYYEETGLNQFLDGDYLPPPKELDVMKPIGV